MKVRLPTNEWSLHYPIAVIDFEATALTHSSYPIELGLAIARSPEGEVDVWSSIIRPPATWDIDAEWDPDAEKLHGISRRDLRDGITPLEAMAALNKLTEGIATLWCDGAPYDHLWLNQLVDAGGTCRAFALCDLSALWRRNPEMAERYRDLVAGIQKPHRAGPDAKRICEALRAMLGGHGDA